MVALWYLLLLAPFVVLAVLWLNYRRKQAARERDAMLRWQRVVTSKSGDAGGNSVGAASSPAASVNATAQLRGRLLEPADALFYRLLQNVLPDHDLFVGVSADRVLVAGAAASPLEREARQRAWSRLMVDFLVCDRNFRPRVAVLMDAGVEGQALAETLRGTGLRCVTFARARLPKRHELRALLLDEMPSSPKVLDRNQ